MAEFEDNVAITTEDLNNIAVDLGDTTFSAFSNEKFGVDKLNEITADIVGKGVLNISNKCEAVLNGGIVYIQSGVIVFESGAKIRITSPVEVAASAGDYIFAFNDVTTGKASIQTATAKPTSGDYVMLAQVDEEGTIVDLRQMAVAKTTLSADVENNIVEKSVTFPAYYTGKTYGTVEIDVVPGLPSCKILYILDAGWGDIYKNAVILSEKEQYIVDADHSGWSSNIYVKKTNGILTFKRTQSVSNITIKFLLA